MLARLIWALVFVLVLVVLALIWISPAGYLPNQDPSVGAALRTCASNPQMRGCK